MAMMLESPVDSGSSTSVQAGDHRHLPGGGDHQDGIRPSADRGAVDVARRRVRSTTSSPVSYNAPFDPKLRLWVAACLYRYFVDQHEFLCGPLRRCHRRRRLQDAKQLGPRCRCRRVLGRRVAFGSTGSLSLDGLQIDARAGAQASSRGGLGSVSPVADARWQAVQPVCDDEVLGAGFAR